MGWIILALVENSLVKKSGQSHQSRGERQSRSSKHRKLEKEHPVHLGEVPSLQTHLVESSAIIGSGESGHLLQSEQESPSPQVP